MGMGNYLHGTGTYVIRGADPEGCLNRLTGEGVSFWEVERCDDFTFRFTASAKEEQNILSGAKKAYCESSCEERRGLKEDLSKALRRPVLFLSVILAFCLSFFLESVIWDIQIYSGEEETNRCIYNVLRDLGVDIWSSTKDLDPQNLRYAILRELPQVSWVAVNPKGGKVTVLALLREESEAESSKGPENLVAHRDGVITESIVLEGMPLAKVGDSVKKGQVLVSGLEDYGLYLKAVKAAGEIYGQTWHQGTLVTPSKLGVKEYTGATRQEIQLLFGRKIINLSGSSSNLGLTCDKIIDTIQLSPPGYSFPLFIQRITYREYVVKEHPISGESARELLCRSWESSILSSMIGGQIQHTDSVCFEKGGLYIFQGESICHELLSRPMDIELPEKGADPNGTDH